MRIDVYDFDHTLYDGDTIVDFWRFEVGRHPSLLRFLPRQIPALLKRLFGIWDAARAKSAFQCYFTAIDLESEVAAFWERPRTQRKLFPFLEDTPSDLPRVVVSASARPVLLPVAELLTIDAIIATEIDPRTGRLLGANCSGAEKVAALERHFPGFRIRAMYTDDSRTDAPLLALAEERYLLKKGRVIPI